VLYCCRTLPRNKKLFLTHIDIPHYINDVCNKINYWIRDNQNQNVNIHLLSAHQEWTELQEKIKERIPNHAVIQASLNTGEQKGECFTIDTEGNYQNTVDMKNLQYIGSIEMANMAALSNVYEGINNKNLALELVIDEKVPLKTREKLLQPRQPRLGSVEAETQTTSALTPPKEPQNDDTNNLPSKNKAPLLVRCNII
jgi:hypothetical protein